MFENKKLICSIQIFIVLLISLILIIRGADLIRTNSTARTYNVDFGAIKQTEDDDGNHLLLR